MSKQWISNGQEYKIGNIVRVMRQAETGETDGMGEGQDWDNSYEEKMDAYLGLTFEIADICEQGVEFATEHNGCSFLFPLTSLEWIAEEMISRRAA